MLNAVIFDLDGVLVDTADLHYMAWKKVSKKYNLACGEDMKDRVKGVSRSDCLDMILRDNNTSFTDETKREVLIEKNNIYLSEIEEISADDVLPGVNALLDFLVSNDYRIALGSASKNATTILKKTHLIRYFESIVDGNMISKAKPDPDVFLKAAELVDTPPHQCLVIEDAKSGVEAAIRAGMKVIGVGEEKLLNSADQVVKNLNEILIKEIMEETN